MSERPLRITRRGHGIAVSAGAELVLTTVAIGRSDSAAEADGGLELSDESSDIEGGFSIRRRAGVHERIALNEEGAEHSWLFENREPGNGPLRIEVAVDGMTHLGHGERGHRFGDDARTVTLTYGDATWIDARGTRIAVAMHFEHGRLVAEVPSDVVDDSSYPAVLDPTVSAEQPVASSIATAETSVLAAWNGTRHLVAYVSSARALYIATLDQTGAFTSAPVAIVEDTAAQSPLLQGVVTTNAGFLVSYVRSPYWGGGTPTPRFGRLVDSDGVPGVVLDYTFAGWTDRHVTASLGNVALLVSERRVGDQHSIVTRRLAADGSVLGTEVTIQGTSFANHGSTYSVAASPSQHGFVVAYQYCISYSECRVETAFVDATTGTASEPVRVATSTGNRFKPPSLACSDARCFVVHSPSGSLQYPRTCALDANGRVLSSPECSLGGADYIEWNFGANSIEFDGKSFLYASPEPAVLRAVRFDELYGRVDSPGFDVAPAAGSRWQFAAFSPSGNGESLMFYTADSSAYVRHIQSTDDLGARCLGDGQCVSGHCVDGVCCDTPCGGNVTSDCQACSMARGATENGTCAALPSTRVCRASAGVCDAAETCDGVQSECPPPASPDPVELCDDSDACTIDSCVMPGGCTHAPTSAPECMPPVDAGMPDAAIVDASTPDASVTDGGKPDSGNPDAAVRDAATDGSSADGSLDGSNSSDGSATDDASGSATATGGCGCSTARTQSPPPAWLLLTLLLVVTRRRRDRAPNERYTHHC